MIPTLEEWKKKRTSIMTDAERRAAAAAVMADIRSRRGEGSPQPLDLNVPWRKMWAEFHTYLAAWDGDVSALMKWLAGFNARIGCGDCKTHWLRLIADSPPDTSGGEALIAWGIASHNDVNLRLGKPKWVK